MKKKIWLILGGLFVAGVAIAGILYLAFPIAMTTYGGMSLNYLKTLSTPAGTVSTESNPAYVAPAAASASTPLADAAWPNAAAGDWPSYNRTPSSQRFSPLTQINTKNVGKLKVLCTYDLHEFTSFETSLIMVNGALIGTTEYDIFSLNPATCAENWRTHFDCAGSLLPSNRGAAYMDGMLFRGTQDARVLAFDFKTGKQLWATTIGDTSHGETVPSSPIAWDGLVYVGNAGGDFKGGKGHMYALEAKTGKIVWEFYLTPKTADDDRVDRWARRRSMNRPGRTRPVFPSPAPGPGPPTPSTSKTGWCMSPAAIRVRTSLPERGEGSNLYVDSVVVLDAKTGNYKNHFQVVPKDWHDYDVSNPPILLQSMGGKQIMAVAPKDGHLYGYDLADNKQLYRVPITTVENDGRDFRGRQDRAFLPGPCGRR